MAFTKIAAAGIGSTELVTLHSLEVLNNATVGGVLTYEDVTNVDSIGLITARNGIVVGSGITLSKDGDGFFTGVTTATTFVGALTGNVTGNVTGNISGGTVAGSTGTFTDDVDIADKIIHTGDTNTAIRFPAADTITAETGGSERLRISSNGNIGIGTAVPAHALDIQGNSGSFTKLALSNQTMNTSKYEIIFGDQGQVNHVVAANREITFATNGSSNERLRIDSDGQIGIGNIAPDTWSTGKSITIGTAQATLWGVGDQVNLSGNAYFNSGWKAAATKAGASQIQQSLGNIDFRVTGSINADAAITWTDALRIDPYGRVLIGGTSAIIGSSSEFNEIVLTGKTRGAGITLQDVDANTRFQIRTDDDGGDPQTLLNASTNHPITIRTNNTEKVRITQDGKFSIGNPASGSPTRLLYVDCGTTGDGMRIVSDEVMGDFVINNTGDGHGRAFVINASRMDSGSYPKLHLAGQGSITFAVDANSTRMTIDSSGNIGAPSGNNIYNASDERLKENMIDLTNGLDKINKLKPVSFTWKNGWSESLDGVTQYGFGAQTTQSVDELLVEPFSTGDVELNGETIENPLRVNEKHIIPLLVKAIQELSAKVAALEG